MPEPTKQSTQQFSLILQVTNNAGAKVILISSDSQPLNGIDIEPRQMLAINKLAPQPKSVEFLAVDPATERHLLINGVDTVTVTPSSKLTVTPLIISGECQVIVSFTVDGDPTLLLWHRSLTLFSPNSDLHRISHYLSRVYRLGR